MGSEREREERLTVSLGTKPLTSTPHNMSKHKRMNPTDADPTEVGIDDLARPPDTKPTGIVALTCFDVLCTV